MILVNTEYVAGRELEMLGMVKGSTIQTKNMFSDIGQGFKNLVGGELKSYNAMMAKARDDGDRRRCGRGRALRHLRHHAGRGGGHGLRHGGALPQLREGLPAQKGLTFENFFTIITCADENVGTSKRGSVW